MGGITLCAESSHCEHHVRALIGKHIVYGKIDRTVQTSGGIWEIIEYNTDDIGISSISDRISFYQTQIELKALLANRLFADQEFLSATIFFTRTGYSHCFKFNFSDLEEVEARWTKCIGDIQDGEFIPGQKGCLMCIGSNDLQCLNQFRL